VISNLHQAHDIAVSRENFKKSSDGKRKKFLNRNTVSEHQTHYVHFI